MKEFLYMLEIWNPAKMNQVLISIGVHKILRVVCVGNILFKIKC